MPLTILSTPAASCFGVGAFAGCLGGVFSFGGMMLVFLSSSSSLSYSLSSSSSSSASLWSSSASSASSASSSSWTRSAKTNSVWASKQLPLVAELIYARKKNSTRIVLVLTWISCAVKISGKSKSVCYSRVVLSEVISSPDLPAVIHSDVLDERWSDVVDVDDT